MWDENCSLWTAAALYNHAFNPAVPYTASTVANKTGAMEGPARSDEQIKDMLKNLDLYGEYGWFETRAQAEQFMLAYSIGSHFGFGYMNGQNGHMIVAVRDQGTIVYYDYQLREQFGDDHPLGVTPQVTGRCIVFPPEAPTDNLTKSFATLSIN